MSASTVSQFAPGLTEREVVARVQFAESELYGTLAERHNHAVISMRMMGEMPAEDAAISEGLSEQAVKARLLRARRLLQRKVRTNLQTAN